MPEVSVDVAGRNYRLGCGEGEEVHLVRLADMVDQEASRLQRKLGQLSEGRLMLMAGLMLADKIVDETAGVEAVAAAEKDRDAMQAKVDAMAEQLAAAEAALQAADERADAAEATAAEKAQSLSAFEADMATKYGPDREAEIAASLDALASRIENLTTRVETPA